MGVPQWGGAEIDDGDDDGGDDDDDDDGDGDGDGRKCIF